MDVDRFHQLALFIYRLDEIPTNIRPVKKGRKSV